LLRPAGEGKTGISPRTPSVVSRSCKLLHLQSARGEKLFISLHGRAPFRLLSIRAPRQAVLRTSSWLAPSITNRPCDLPVEKTRDASNRRLPPKSNCVHPHLVCSRLALATFAAREDPWRIRLHVVLPGDRTFHDVRRTLRRIVMPAQFRPLLPYGLENERGCFIPTAPLRSSL